MSTITTPLGRLVALGLLCWALAAGAATYQIPGDFTVIQQAIQAAAAQGDTVRVAPGHYVENLDFLGKALVLTSHYLPGGDESLVEQTILDGGQNGTVLLFNSGEGRAAEARGFTVTNGSGHPMGFGWTRGGGVYIESSSPTLSDCHIINNQCGGPSGGGGVCILSGGPRLENLVITDNLSQSVGGGLYVGNSSLELDSLRRCSIYRNNAGGYNDIYQFYNNQAPPVFYLGTASLATANTYFMGGNQPVIAEIQQGWLEPVAHDLWVDPDGTDTNSGTSPADPFRTIAHALAVVDADSLNPRTIHLLPGVYALSGGQRFPLNLRSHVILQGASREQTVLDLEFTSHAVMGAYDSKRDLTIQSMTIQRTARMESMVSLKFMQSTNLLLEDLRFTDNETMHIIGGSYFSDDEFRSGTSCTFQNCDFVENHCLSMLAPGLHQTVRIKNCRFDRTTPLEDVLPEDVGLASALSMHGLTWQYPYPFSHRIDNCSFTCNTAFYDEHYTFSPALNVDSFRYPLDIVNCTFADNSSPVSGGLWVFGGVDSMQVRLANCLFWGNSPNQIWANGAVPGLRLDLSHCLVQGMEEGVETINHPVDIRLDEGCFSADPLFVGSGDEPYRLGPGSPAIDAGTALWVVDGDTVVHLDPLQYAGAAPDIGAYEWVPVAVDHRSPVSLPDGLAITTISPNPFNPSTRIHFRLPRGGRVELNLYTIQGRRVAELANAWYGAGEHSVEWRNEGNASGTYLVELRTETGSVHRRLTVLK
jgi:hypothetical protein